jgi:hypothetical protein
VRNPIEKIDSDDVLKSNNPLSIRLNDDTKLILIGISKKTSLNFKDVIELGILEIAQKIKEDFSYNGLNLKDYSDYCYLEKMRKLSSKERNEFLSQNLFILRMRKDIFKLIYAQKKNPMLYDLIMEYMQKRRKEARFYKKNKDLEKEIDIIEQTAKDDIPKLIDYINDNVNIKENFLKSIKKK